jgi:hypothetical protein
LIQKGLPVVGDGLAVTVDNDDRVVEFRSRGPFGGDVDFFRISNSDDTVVFESDCSGPERRDAGARGFEKWGDVL